MTPPENILRRIPAAERKALGKEGQTAEEAMAAFTVRSEKELQQQVSNLLRLRGLKFLNPAMCKKSPLPIGWPDFTVFIPPGRVVFFECKIEGGKLSKEQAEFEQWSLSNGFIFAVVTTLREVMDCLDLLTQTHPATVERG